MPYCLYSDYRSYDGCIFLLPAFIATNTTTIALLGMLDSNVTFLVVTTLSIFVIAIAVAST